MKHRTLTILALLLTLAMLLSACTSNAPSDSTQAEDSGATAQVEDQTTAPAEVSVDLPEAETAPQTPDVELDVDLGLPSPEGVFAGASTALQDLASYRFSTQFVFVGEEDGETESGSIELSGAITSDAQHFVWENLADGERMEFVQIGDEAWILGSDGWESVPLLVANTMSQAVLVFAPSVVWGGFFGELEEESTYVGKDTVNGIPSLHYTSTFNQWGSYWEGDLTDAKGEVWIAEAGYPVKYEFSATGVDEDGDQGSVMWSMEISDVDQSIVIEPPLVETQDETQ